MVQLLVFLSPPLPPPVGPEITPGPNLVGVAVPDLHELVCGTDLVSNPPSIITWTDPMGNMVVNGGRYTIISDSNSVRLELASTIPEDDGTWTCTICVNGVNVTMPGGEIVEEVLINEVNILIDLYIVCKSFNNLIPSIRILMPVSCAVAPGRPLNLSVDGIGAMWASLSWLSPVYEGRPGISRYTVIATNTDDGSIVSGSTTDGREVVRELNLTGLLPGVEYEFRVQAVASERGVDNEGVFSNTVASDTIVTGNHTILP